MTRNLKALGLALVAVFAMSAVVASAASAQSGVFTTDGVRSTLHIKENTGVGSGPNKLTAFNGDTACPGTVFTGHEVNSTTVGVPNGATSATLIPKYGPCTTTDATGAKFSTTVDMNTCDFVVHIGATTGGVVNTYGITGTVVCTKAGDHIQVTLFSSASHALRVCTLTITQPGAVTGPHLTTDTVNDDINVKGSFTPFVVHKSGICGSGEDKNGSLHIDATITGTDAAKNLTGVTITDK
jgi:triacylglycerol esterase/lipase EstA (alpha/beta hydrolase family)